MEEACGKAEESWDLLSHHKPLMVFNFAFAQFESLGCVIVEVTRSWVPRELTKKNILGWVYMACPGMAVVNCTKDLGNMEALTMIVEHIQEFNNKELKEGMWLLCWRGWY